MKARTRSSGSSTVNALTVDRWWHPQSGGPDYVNGQSTSYNDIYYHHMTGWDILNYHKRKKAGELLPMTPYTEIYIKGEATGALSTTTPGQGTNYYNESVVWRNEWAIQPSELIAIAGSIDTGRFVQAAASKIYSSGFDGLTFLAELKGTVRLFKRLFESVIKLLRKEDLESLYLQSRYGWRTLIFDIQDIITLINSINEKRNRYSERLGSTEKFYTTQEIQENWTSSSQTLLISDETSIGVRGSVVADIQPPKIAVNPITTAWELVPYSFVIDWFITVGSYLESLSFLALQTQYTAAGGISVEITRTAYVENVTWNNGCSGDREIDAFCSGYYRVRTPTSVPYRPYPTVNLDAFKIADLIALMLQLVHRR